MAASTLDALAGYAYSNNQLQRQISIPGLQPRTANGSTGANQFLGQVEIGYKVRRMRRRRRASRRSGASRSSSVNQAAFTEWGANSLSLNVRAADDELAALDAGRATQRRDRARRHAHARYRRCAWAGCTSMPTPAGRSRRRSPAQPANASRCTAPRRNATAAVIGFQASTNVATATQLYLRYDGDIGSGTDNHVLNLGLRIFAVDA